MEGEVIYDIINEGYTEWSFILKGFTFLILLLILANTINYYLSKEKKIECKGVLWSIFAVFIFTLFSVIWILLTYPPYKIAKEARIRNEYKIVSGRVRNIELRYGKIPSQKFYVRDVLFWVEDGGYHPGYNKTIQKGAPFYTGECLMIWYYEVGSDNAILRLEVLKDDDCSK